MEIFRFPLVRVTLCFICGIVASQYLDWSWIALSGAGAILVLLAISLKNPKVSSLILLTASCIIGFAVSAAGKWSSDPGHYLKHITGRAQILQVELGERLKPTAHQRYVASVSCIDGKETDGKLLLQLPPAALHPIGTQLLIAGKPVRNRPPQNPDQFDYGRYLDSHNIPAQCFVRPGNLAVICVRHDFFHYADVLCGRIMGNLRRSGFGNESLGVLGALVLGQRQDIAAQTVSDYQLAGAVHILSVSGLHVGFIAVFLNVLLRPLTKTRFWRRFSLAAVILSLWIFAGVSGLSPSVVRAATMFSLMAVGRHLHRETESLHAVIVSALVILIVAPEFLFDVGFQLSYAAVVSILLFEPHFRNLVRVKSIVLKYIRDIVTVSLAAQIGTLPLSLFYFHQFPGLFLATNLVVIPMLSIIMALGIIVMALAVFGITLSWVNWPLEESLELMNSAIAKIASCDAFVARNIPADSAMLLLGFSVVLALWLCIRKPDFRSMARAGAAVIVLQTYVLYFGWKESLPEAVLVFQQSRMSVVAVRDGRRLVAYGDGEMPPNGPASAYATAHGLSVQNRPMPRLLFADGRKILLWSAGNLPNRGLRADILLLCQSPKINFERLVMQLHPKLVIADGSNYGIAKRNWRRTCQKQKIPFHDTDEKGCFVLSGAIRTSSSR